MGRILVFLLFLGAGLGVYKAFQDYKAWQKAERNVWPEKLAPLLTLHAPARLLEGKVPRSQESFFQLLNMAHQIEQDGYPVLDTLKRGAVLAGADATQSVALATALMDNLSRARSLGVFQDPANILNMERGQPPLAGAPGWEEEPLAVGYKLSPLFGTELSALLPNMVVMPEAARDMQTDATPPEAQALTSQWLGSRLISPECAFNIREKIRLDTERR